MHAKGILVRKTALERSGMCHDLLRFLDFRPGAGPQIQATPKWGKIRNQFPEMRHESAATAFLEKEGFAVLG